MREYYATLNLQEGASYQEVKKASRKLLLKYHPDLHPQNSHWAQEKTKTILSAYQVLSEILLSTEIVFKDTDSFKKQTAPATVPFMQFELSGISFAIRVTNIKNITLLKNLKITTLSSTKGLYPYLVGIVNYSGGVAPLLDLGVKLNIGTKTDRSQVIFCEYEGHPLALIIDNGKGIINVTEKELNDNEYLGDSVIDATYVANVLMVNNQKVHILDLEQIITN